MRSLALVLLVAVALLGCRLQFAGKAGAWQVAYGGSFADPRISEGQVDTDADGLQVYMSKQAASPEFLHMVEVVLPEVVAAAVKAALLSAGIGAAGGILDGVGGDEVVEEVVTP